MLNFAPIRNKEMTLTDLVRGLTVADLRALTNEMIDTMLNLIADCLDEDVQFLPHDPAAYDAYAVTSGEANLAWTLGHVIVHTTASAEENAFIASEMARGVPYHGRSRSEIPWEMVTTIAQCRHRLEESRRMRLATLDIWPDMPYLNNTYQRHESAPAINAFGYFVSGLRHDDSHLGQIGEIVRQAMKAREVKMVRFAKERTADMQFGRS